MKVTSIETHKIKPGDSDLFAVLDKYIPKLKEGSIVAVASKIVAICDGRVVKIGTADKEELIEAEAEYFLPASKSKYDVSLTIKDGLLVPTAGIDESNGNGYYILWPANSQETANQVRQHLSKKFSLGKVGVIITDSKTSPSRWGTIGIAIAHSGFAALKNYIGEPDIFGRKLKMTQANIMDALAVAAVLTMGEGREQTPIAIIEDVLFVKFQKRNPTKKELSDLRIAIEDDLYAPLLKSVKWRKGKKK